jgi:hypothetical protein
MRLALITLLLALCGCVHGGHAPDPHADLDSAIAPAFSGDMPEVLTRLRSIADSHLGASEQQTRRCVLARFSEDPSANDTGAGAVPEAAERTLQAFRRYWTNQLLHQSNGHDADVALSIELRAVTGLETLDTDAQVDAALDLIRSKGLHALGGTTAPFRELMIWKDERSFPETVLLPSGPIDVRVTLLDSFESLGWAAWATCDRSHTGGWTDKSGIKVVAPSYDLSGEAFRVSLLSHEAQHFRDGSVYPSLAQEDLEFRAKLIELIMARSTQHQLLVNFHDEAVHDRLIPHGYASYWLLKRLAVQLGVDPLTADDQRVIADGAMAVLAAHTAELDHANAQTVRSALPD